MPLCQHYSKLATEPGDSMMMQIEVLLVYQSKTLPECLGDRFQ